MKNKLGFLVFLTIFATSAAWANGELFTGSWQFIAGRSDVNCPNGNAPGRPGLQVVGSDAGVTSKEFVDYGIDGIISFDGPSITQLGVGTDPGTWRFVDYGGTTKRLVGAGSWIGAYTADGTQIDYVFIPKDPTDGSLAVRVIFKITDSVLETQTNMTSDGTTRTCFYQKYIN